MSGASWATAALLLLHLTGVGALPKEVPASQVAGYASGQRLLRILIFSHAASLVIRPSAAAVVEEGETGQQIARVKAGATLTLHGSLRGVSGLGITRATLRIRPAGRGACMVSGTGGWGRRGRYPGVLDVTAVAGRLRVVESVDLESYVAGVVAAEVPRSFPLQAMAAQAVAARTYALFHLGDHEAEGADLCSQVHCQAYAGLPARTSKAFRAARATAGQVLTWHGVLVDAQYHSACGGSTATAWETRQGKLLPYLVGVDDSDGNGPYCGQGHVVSWSERLTYAEAQQYVARNLGTVIGEPGLAPGRLVDLRVAERAGDRVKWLAVETSRGTYRVMGDSIRWLFGKGFAGPSGLRSTRFSLRVARDGQGRPKSFLFRGSGHGHGLGLCQWGARGRALAGQQAQEILEAYYPGAQVVKLSEGSVGTATASHLSHSSS